MEDLDSRVSRRGRRGGSWALAYLSQEAVPFPEHATRQGRLYKWAALHREELEQCVSATKDLNETAEEKRQATRKATPTSIRIVRHGGEKVTVNTGV